MPGGPVKFYHNRRPALSAQIVGLLQLAAHSVPGFLHQLYGAFRSRLDRALEEVGIPDVVSCDGQHYNHKNRRHEENIPNGGTVESGFRNLRIPIPVQGRPDVERREYASNDEVHGPESKLLARTDPMDYEYDYSPFVGGRELWYPLPPPRSEHPILRIEDQGVDLSVLEESIWVEGFRVWVDVGITKERPEILHHNCTCRDEVSPIYVVLGGFFGDAEGEGWVPPEEFLRQSVDIRQIFTVRKVREVSFANDPVELLLRFLHDVGVENHYQEERLQDRACLKAVSEGRWGGPIATRTYRYGCSCNRP